MADLQAALDKEKAFSKGWYENWKGKIVERDQLKSDNEHARMRI